MHIIAGFSATYFPFIHHIPELCSTDLCSTEGCIIALGVTEPEDHDLWYQQRDLGPAPLPGLCAEVSEHLIFKHNVKSSQAYAALLSWKLLAACTWRKTGSSGPHVLITLVKSIMHRKGTCWQWKWLESTLPVRWVNWEFISTGDNSLQIPFRVSPAWGCT